MCRFVEIMENFQGDLTDIVRGTAVSHPVHEAWRDPVNFISTTTSLHDPSCTAVIDASFGDPFSAMSDPLLHELHLPLHEPAASSSSAFFISPPAAGPAPPLVEDVFCGGESNTASNSISGSSSSSNNNIKKNSNMSVLRGHYKIFDQDDNSKLSNPPCGILSRIQISPSGKAQMGCDSPAMVSPRGGVKKAVVAGAAGAVINGKAGGCLIDGAGPVQISSPRNLGIKRRKNQAKKVVCIPAPAAANSRSTGEVVPSDLWAWRKYGQKPIKGSPYPRGYYRCSSSKGCSARKQVERSRTDPNTLVITYTSEHNHPWPTQRNALAGSTRSQPSKATTTKKSDAVEAAHHHHSSSASGVDGAVPDLQSPSTDVKEEELADDQINKPLAAGDGGAFSSSQCYRPEMISPEEAGSNCHHHHQLDLFAGLDEIEADPLNDLLFSGAGYDDDDDEASCTRLQKEGGVVDPFMNIFDWSGEMIRRSLSP